MIRPQPTHSTAAAIEHSTHITPSCRSSAGVSINSTAANLMRDSSLRPVLRIVHLAVFLAIALQGWAQAASRAVRQILSSAAHALSLTPRSPSPQSQPRRGKRPKAPQALAVILADAAAASVPLQKLADLLTWYAA